jgi:transposase
MDRASLEELLGRGLSLAEIGRRFRRHESTVGYWVEKFGLEAVNREKVAAKGRLSPEELEPLVEAGMSIARIAAAIGRTQGSVRHWLGKYGLRTNAPRGGSSRDGVREAREAGKPRATIRCPQHGETEHIREPRGYYRCGRCRQDAVIRRRRKAKELLVGELGGSCRLCGYDRCLAALEFHHLDPEAKAFGVASRGAHGIERLRAEVRKCILLCSNCHAEVESGISSIPG